MLKDKNIIVATDFSERSFDVIQKAIDFCNLHSSILHIVHVVEESFIPSSESHDAVIQTSFELLLEKFPALQKKYYHCVEGSVQEQLAQEVDKLDAKLVILGSSGENSALQEFFLGSYTKAIVRHMKVPVLVVKLHEELNYKNIMIATDLTDASKTHIQKVTQLFPQAQIRLFYTYVMPFKNRLGFYGMNSDEIFNFFHELRQKAHKEALTFYESLHIDEQKVKIVVKEGHLNTEFFLNEMRSMQCDLLSMHTSGKVSFFAFDLLNDSTVDVLIDKL